MHNKNIKIKYLIFSIFILSVFTFGTRVLADYGYWVSRPEIVYNETNIRKPINVGPDFQSKNGSIIVHGFRSVGPAILDVGFTLSPGAGAGKVLTSDAEGSATWQNPQGGGGVTWGSITGPLYLQSDLQAIYSIKALLNNPTLTGDPQAPNPPVNDNDTTIATTKFVTDALDGITILSNGWTRTSGLVSMVHSTDNLSIGANSILYRTNGTAGEANRFLHNNGTNNFSLGLGAGNINASGNGTGSNNTAFGKFALASITNGASFPGYNTAFGHQSLTLNTIGQDNTAFGYQALYSNNSASSVFSSKNTAVGYQALYNNTTANNNTAVGYQALYNNTTGGANIGFGYRALYNNTIGSGNTAIGYGADVSANNLSNATAIGYNAVVSASDTMVFGNSDVVAWGFGTQPGAGQAIKVGTTTSNGNGASLTTAGVWTSASDLNKKTNIQNLNYGLKEVLRLRPVSFDWKDSNIHDIGFIAQEVKEVIPELVYGTEGDLSLAYSQIPVVLVNAIAEQQKEIEEYRLQLESLKERLQKLKE